MSCKKIEAALKELESSASEADDIGRGGQTKGDSFELGNGAQPQAAGQQG